jgi:two-component system cell cycle sensor histidine kinase/response regulator CckA
MQWHYNPYTIPLFTAVTISAVLTAFVWRRRPAPGLMPFLLLLLSVAEWSLAYALELGSVHLTTKVFWSQVKYIGVAFVPLSWLTFALKYTGRTKWLKPRNVVLLLIEPFLTLLLVWTNPLHGLIWSTIEMETIARVSMRVSTYGAWFWLNVVYSYILIFLGAILLVKFIIRSPHFYREQVGTVLIGVIVPWVGNGLNIFHINPFPNLDLTPFAFTLTVICLSWSFFRLRLLDIVPAARDAVIESMNDVVMVLDTQNRIVDLNPAAKFIIGQTESKIIGQSAAEVLSNWPDLSTHLGDLTGTHFEIVLGKGEAQRYFDLRISPLNDRHGRLTGRLLVARDITELKQAEGVLQKAHDELEKRIKERTAELVFLNEQLKQGIEERKRAEEALQDNLKLIGRAKREWESTVDSLPQLILLLDSQGFILRTNRTVERWNLGQVTRVKGQRIHELIHSGCTDSTCYFETYWHQAWKELASGQSAEYEADDPMLKRYIHVQGRPILPPKYKEGEETESFVVVVVSDITERKHAEELLRESEEYLKTLLDSIHAGIMVIDGETHKIIDVNFYGLEMIGFKKEQISGHVCHEHVCPAEIGKCPVTDLQQTVDSSESVLIKANGEQIPILKSVVPITRKERRYLIESFVDITERKQVEREKVALEEQLLQSQKMEAIGRLAGGVAHDFNNLLTPITGYSQLAISSLSPSDPMRNDLQEIQKAADRAAALTRQLLVFSRRQSLKPQVLNLNNIILDIGKMLRRLIGEQIELVILPGPNLGSIKLDPSQFEQVIVNLAVNARDAMPNGGRLILETTNVTLDEDYVYQHTGITPGNYIMLAVSDTGTGITDEVKTHLFEPFFTTKEKGKGTGLGLSMVYGIIKQSNGHILVYSESGLGTTFKIYLPRVEEEMTALPRRDDIGYMPKGNETVLLVEDEPLVRGLAIRVLREQGYNVLEAANGMEALNVAQEHVGEKIHLLLTDVVMPQMGGKELADRLKAFRPGIKVLFTSGYTDQAIVQRGLLNPDFSFLEKPFSPSGLVRQVREVLDR